MKSENKIGSDTIIRRNESLLFSKMDEEVVMLSIENSEYYGMNNVGSRIWELIEHPQKVGDLIQLLTKEYEVEQKECENDVLFYLDELLKKNVILRSGNS